MIEVYSFCYNEKYILPYFFKHYSFADKIYIYDNGSTDGSIELIKELGGEVIPFDTEGHLDNRTLMNIRNTCWKGSSAEWVIVCDIDEFLIGHEVLSQYSGEVVFKTEGWQMVGTGQPLEEINTGFRDTLFDKMICFSPRITELNSTPGHHSSSPVGGTIVKAMKLYHYEFISEEYLVKRRQKNAARSSDNDKKNKFGFQYLEKEEIMRKTYKEAVNISIDLSKSDLPRDSGSLKHFSFVSQGIPDRSI
jgi:glycosyltransferase involved in cell wall biosynthesis